MTASTLVKTSLLAAIGFAAILANCASASASSLIGKTIQADYFFPDSSSLHGSFSITVAAGNSDAVSFFDIFSLDPEASGFKIPSFSFRHGAFWLPTPFNGFNLSSLNFDDSSSITGYTLDTNMIGLDASRISFTGNTFNLNWQGLSFDTNTYVNVGFKTDNTTAVPTPALLPGLIGLGMGVLRKRKREAAEQATEA